MTRTTTRTITAKDGRVLAPSTKIEVIPPSRTWIEDGWRFVFLVDERGQMVKLSEHDLRVHTHLVFA